MEAWKSLILVLIHFGNFSPIKSFEIVPFGSPLSRLPENLSPSRDRSRYRHGYPINPIIRTAGNNQTFAPILWDLAPDSYPIDFFLYTKDNPYLAEVLTIGNATDSKYFDRGKLAKVIIHDFMQSSENMLIYDLKDAYMNKKENYNVILVDWEAARKYAYTVAVTVSEYVGKVTSRLIQSMKVDPAKVHVIGFGLGAHAAGVMGNDVKVQNNKSLARITGLDPSLPLFRMSGNYFKLDPEDAAFVDVIHTDGGDNLWNSNHLGMGQQCGHVDIYPNRGIFQPGCRQSSLPNYDSLQCSHTRALEIFKESIQDEMSYVACRCSTWEDFTDSRCNCMHDSNRILVGEPCSSSALRGNYYLVTLDGPPYGLGGKGVMPSLGLTRSTDPGIAMQNLFAVNGSLFQGISQIAAIFTAPIKPFLNSLVRNARPINSNTNGANNQNSNRPDNNDNNHNENPPNTNNFLLPPPPLTAPLPLEPIHNEGFQNFQQDAIIGMNDEGDMNNYNNMQFNHNPVVYY